MPADADAGVQAASHDHSSASRYADADAGVQAASHDHSSASRYDISSSGGSGEEVRD